MLHRSVERTYALFNILYRLIGMTAKLDRITTDPAIMTGQPCIRGMRLTVRRVIEALAIYPNWDDLRAEYPELEPEDIRQALAFAALSLDDQIIDLDVA